MNITMTASSSLGIQLVNREKARSADVTRKIPTGCAIPATHATTSALISRQEDSHAANESLITAGLPDGDKRSGMTRPHNPAPFACLVESRG